MVDSRLPDLRRSIEGVPFWYEDCGYESAVLMIGRLIRLLVTVRHRNDGGWEIWRVIWGG